MNLTELLAFWRSFVETPWGPFIIGSLGLLISTQLVVSLLDRVEKGRFGSVRIGTLLSPLCTGFPNVVIGVFGQEGLGEDLVLHLNIGNNLANTSLVIGVVLLVAGPLTLRGKKWKKEDTHLAVGLGFLWLGLFGTIYFCWDGQVHRWEGLVLIGIFVLHHVLVMRGGKGRRKKSSFWPKLVLVSMLALAGLAIYHSLGWIERGLQETTKSLGPNVGLFLGLLTVLPESFLLLRLALRKGQLGLSGIVGDCLVSVPFVVGLGAALRPFETTPPMQGNTVPFVMLGFSMLVFSIVALKARKLHPRLGLLFLLIYGMVWVLESLF